MMKRVPLVILFVLLAAFGVGLYQLLALRMKFGDVYPPYSSLRADPLGTMALHEALERIPGMTVRRDFSAQNKLPHGQGVAYLHVGAQSRFWQNPDEDLLREAERFAVSGGRLIILLYPETSKLGARSGLARDADEKKPKKKSGKLKKREPTSALKARWGFGLRFVALESIEEGSYEPDLVRNAGIPSLPHTLEWHSALVLTNLPPEWQPVYSRGTNVVMAELIRGPGSVVIGTDSYYLSNEALSSAPESRLLSWLVGARNNIVFDEAHLGTLETRGVAELMRKYRLEWFLGALLLVALLFVWKESSRFVPRALDERRADFIAGKSASAGFINLLRRSVPSRELPRVCLDQWKHACMHGPGAETKAAVAETVMRTASGDGRSVRDPVRVYNELCAIIKTRSNPKKHDERTTE